MDKSFWGFFVWGIEGGWITLSFRSPFIVVKHLLGGGSICHRSCETSYTRILQEAAMAVSCLFYLKIVPT